MAKAPTIQADLTADATLALDAGTEPVVSTDPDAPVDPVDPVDPVEPPANCDFPIAALKRGAVAARRAWAPGYSLRLGTKGNRGKVERSFMATGSRSGEVVWKPGTMNDLLANDWYLISDPEGEAAEDEQPA